MAGSVPAQRSRARVCTRVPDGNHARQALPCCGILVQARCSRTGVGDRCLKTAAGGVGSHGGFTMKGRLLGLGAVLLLATSLSPRLAGAAGVLLRYHFVAGQVITYRVTSTARL